MAASCDPPAAAAGSAAADLADPGSLDGLIAALHDGRTLGPAVQHLRPNYPPQPIQWQIPSSFAADGGPIGDNLPQEWVAAFRQALTAYGARDAKNLQDLDWASLVHEVFRGFPPFI